MKQDNLFLGKEAREKLMVGVRKIANAVGMTMGTSGQNSLIECIERPGHYSTNDGYSIANSIKLAEPLEEMGRLVLLEAINRANKSSGDGSSTTCVLTSAILEEGMKHIGESSPMEIKRSLEACIPTIEESINSQKKEVDVNNVAQVATISAEDEKIGKMIQEIYKKIGKEGIIHWDVSKTAEDSYSIGTGITIHGATYASPYMCDISEEGNLSNTIRWKNPQILLCRQKIASATELNDLLQSLFNKDIRELVIFCDEIEVPVIADLIRTRAVRGFKTAVIKMPVLWRDEWWEDLALVTNATPINPLTGLNLQKAGIEHLGSVENIVVTKEDTFLDGIQSLKKHIKALQEEGSEASLLRASRLNTKTARYFVGAHSESALAYRRLKVEDALNAAACALENGVVAGGGIALRQVEFTGNSVGEKILKSALNEPFKRIVTNAGLSEESLVSKKNLGFDSRTGNIVDMFEAGIIDPTDVVLNAVRNAIGVAASILTIGTVVTLPREEEKAPL